MSSAMEMVVGGERVSARAGEEGGAVVALASAATQVTLFEDRAEVVRTARASAKAGVQWIAVGGVSPFVDDRSVQAKVAGERARVTAARVVRRMHHARALGREQVEALENEAREARRRAEAAARSRDRAELQAAHAAQLFAQWAGALAQVPRGLSRAEGLAGWRAAHEQIARAAAEAREAAAGAEEARVRAEDDRARAEQRLAEGLVEKPRYETVVEVQVEADEAQELSLEVVYRVPCALWRPEHLARLITEGHEAGAGTVEVVTYATAWQATGEAWEDVEVCFSTARPARAATPPPVRDDVLATRRKSDAERRTVVVEAREQAVMLAGLDRGARAVDEMPGVDDGGVVQTFAPRARVTIASDGRPFRVEVTRARVPARVERVLFPERAPVAHVRATATLAGAGPLLAGPVRVARGASLVGRAKVDYVGRGEPFELGFGVDDGVRVRREQSEERDTVPVLGTQKLERTVRVFLSNLSDEARRVLVTERVPVSEIEDVEVSLLDARGWRHDAKDGYARAEVELPPRGTRELSLVYEVRAAAKVVMPF